MKKPKKEKSFLHLPQYPGGKEAFIKFIRENLQYPKEAMEHKIQGKVYLVYQVNDYGDVIDVQVTRGIGYGCDEEAMRIIRLMKYDKVKNRGVRLISTIKTHIEFKLAQVNTGISYSYTETKKPSPIPGPAKPEGEVYGYTITITPTK